MATLADITIKLDITMRSKDFSSGRDGGDLKYEKRNSPIDFVATLTDGNPDKGKYAVYFDCNYNMPEHLEGERFLAHKGQDMFPQVGVMEVILADADFNYSMMLIQEDRVDGRNVKTSYELTFKADVSEDKLRRSVSEVLDYVCETVTKNIGMLETVHTI
jgi:hypothetical protein